VSLLLGIGWTLNCDTASFQAMSKSRNNQVICLPTNFLPYLSLDSTLHDLIKFLDKHKWCQQWARVEMWRWIEPGLLKKLLTDDADLDICINSDLERALCNNYCPGDVTATLSLLKAEKSPKCKSPAAFKAKKYLDYVQTFAGIMQVCAAKCPTVNQCVDVLLGSTQPVELSRYLRIKGPYETSASNLVLTFAEHVHQYDLERLSNPPKRWPKNMCLGCGHVMSPPHRRDCCPYHMLPGWCAHGVPSEPVTIPNCSPSQ
jgi:hypothetical protein